MTTPTLVLVTGLPGTGKTSLAQLIASDLGAAVIGHDWIMAGLRSAPQVWGAMEDLDRREFRSVGWSVLRSLALAQLREGRSIVLDGVARSPEVDAVRRVAQRLGARCFVVLCALADEEVHRARIRGRSRDIPNWPEISWENVERSRSTWVPPEDPDLVVDSIEPIEMVLAQVRAGYPE